DIARLLIAHGADIHAHDKRGDTPLRTAAAYGRANVITVLLASGADVNRGSPSEDTPLNGAVTGAATTMETRLEVARLLLAAGADVNAKDPGGRAPLLAAIGMFSAISAAPTKDDGMIEWLLAHGADVRTRDLQGGSALEYAAGTGNRHVVKLLLDRMA